MITERDEDRRNDRAALAWSLIVSALLNLAIWIIATGAWSLRLHALEPHGEKPEEFVVSSSALQIEHRTVPVPAHAMTVPRPQTHPVPQQAQRQPRVAQRQPRTQPTEIAREVPNAPPQPRNAKARHEPASLAQELAQQEQQFAREAQQLNASRAPLSIATSAPVPPSAYRRTYMDLNGKNQPEQVEALLLPLPGKHWFDNGMSCYYVHYYAQYGGGGTEEGNIPWPLCYPANHDAMLPLDRPHELPVPAPPVGFVLPPGTELGPLLKAIYTGAIH